MKIHPISHSVTNVKEAIMTESRPANPKVIYESCGNKYTSGAGVANH